MSTTPDETPVGEESVASLEFSAAIPDLKLLPVNYDKPAPASERTESPTPERKNDELLQLEAINFMEVTPRGKKTIKSGSLPSLVKFFLMDSAAAPEDLHKFLMCYRRWCSPGQLWSVIMRIFYAFDRYNPEDEKDLSPETLFQQRNAVISFIITWIERCSSQDFFSSKEKFANPLWKSLHEFIRRLEHSQCQSWAKSLVEKLKERNGGFDGEIDLRTDYDYRGVVWSITQTLFPRSLVPGEFQLLDIHAQEVAQCLTLTEYNLFRNIRINEFLEKTWIKDEGNSLIYVMVNRFNHVAFWAATEIVSQDNLYNRKMALERFIQVAQACYEMNNFNSTMEMMAGLSMGPVSRLKKTWAAISRSSLETFKMLEDEMKPMKNYYNYRKKVQLLTAAKVPLLPYVGLLLKDLTFIDENPDKADGGLINFEKVDLLGTIMMKIEYFQQQTFSLIEVEEPILNFLNNLHVQNEDDLYQLSLKQEPRGS
ncbi:Ral guanine nucleotide dissociation stimulator-like 3a [Balamuthia mandrillaris]